MSSSLIFRRMLCFHQKRYLIQSISLSSSSSSSSSPSLSKDITSKMKKLLDDKPYRQVLNLFDKQTKPWKDTTIPMAIKACIYLNEHQRIQDIEEKLSPSSLNNRDIQTTLIQFHSENN